jgi:hypothetical protein
VRNPKDILRIFIGYDHVEAVAYHTLAHSINKLSSMPVQITPVMSHHIKAYTRERDPKQSNDFSFTRFLVPWMCGYQGYALFMDCDMLLRGDIYGILGEIKDRASVWVVQHDYTPRDEYKYLGAKQYAYPKKNWSSVMLFDCEQCRELTPDYVNTASPMELHQFKWAEKVGELPLKYNHLVGEYDYSKEALIAHFTVGGPYFNEYADCDYSDEWYEMHADMNHCAQCKGVKDEG